MDNFDHASRLLFVLESVGNTVEPRYFEVPREMEKKSLNVLLFFEEQVSNSAFCQFVIEFLSETLHVSQALLSR